MQEYLEKSSTINLSLADTNNPQKSFLYKTQENCAIKAKPPHSFREMEHLLLGNAAREDRDVIVDPNQPISINTIMINML